jgi:tetrahydromethanopterin S-methyltransferase subunit H
VFPSVALVNTAIAQASIEEGRRPDRTHPIYRIP